jgi:hypothetical protein
LCSNLILEFRQRKGGRRWEELDGELHGFGMSKAILEAGNDLVVPSSNWMRYCGEILGSIGMSTTMPEQGISSLLEFGSLIRVPGGVWFADRRGIPPVEQEEEATIINYSRINQRG